MKVVQAGSVVVRAAGRAERGDPVSKPLVLVVDDQPGVRRLLFEAFHDDGFEVELASGGAEALRKLRYVHPAVVLLDLRMPGLSGLDTLREIRERMPDLKVVIMTAYGEMDMVREAQEMGVQWYLTKPFDLGELRCLLGTVMDGVAVAEVQEGEIVAAT